MYDMYDVQEVTKPQKVLFEIMGSVKKVERMHGIVELELCQNGRGVGCMQ